MSNSDTRTNRNLSIETRKRGLQVIEINICWLCYFPGIKNWYFFKKLKKASDYMSNIKKKKKVKKKGVTDVGVKQRSSRSLLGSIMDLRPSTGQGAKNGIGKAGGGVDALW